MPSPTIAFVGLGYIGLPTAVVLANHGHHVVGIDIDTVAVDRINSGRTTIVEPGLEEQLQQALASGRFTATTSMIHADAYIIAVPTPFTGDREGDLTYIMAAAESIAPHLRGGELLVLESTSPPGTTQKMADHILALRPDLIADGAPNSQGLPQIYFAHCPERILPGNAMQELITNDRIIGGCTFAATERATAIYASFCTGQLLPTDALTAELAKLTENSFRDVNIAFANELSLIAANLGVDVWELIELANHHPRVNILQPGPGVGGHCIAVDPWFIVAADRQNSQLIRTAREVNDRKPIWVIQQVKDAIAQQPGANIAALGLAFKPNIDDLRESPALDITAQLATELPQTRVLAVEPHISALPPRLADLPNIQLTDRDAALDQADIVLLLVDHDAFKDVAATALTGKQVIDTKGLWR